MPLPDLPGDKQTELLCLLRGVIWRALFPVTPDEAAQEHSGEDRSGLGRACRNAVPGTIAERRAERALSPDER
jgi:hypothetical protein